MFWLLLNSIFIFAFLDLYSSRTISYDKRAFLIDGKRKSISFGTFINQQGHKIGISLEKLKLWVNFRIGPYVCAEWNLGGVPVWVKNIPGIVFRDYNAQWLNAMSTFVRRLTLETIQKKYFYHQGGPIIMAQIENEYGNVEKSFPRAKEYIDYVVSLAQNLTNKEPWIMCAQLDAPNVSNLINTCNGFYCEDFLVPHFQTRNTPAAWTENWSGWYQLFGDPKPYRPPQDLAYGLARWIANGGSHFNYYMYFGGTNWARTTGGPFVTQTYDYNSPLDEFALFNEPKYTHLNQIHALLKKYSHVILNNEVDPGRMLKKDVYVNFYGRAGTRDCIAFLSNTNRDISQSVVWMNKTYSLPKWSVSILEHCEKAVYNTAVMTAKPTNLEATAHPISMKWSWWKEPVGIWDSSTSIHSISPLEQVKTTSDTTDYLWYSTTVRNYNQRALSILNTSANDVCYVFVNNKFQNYIMKANPTTTNVALPMSGDSKLNILCASVGLKNFGGHYENMTKGILGSPITLSGVDITKNGWNQQVGLKGENLKVWTHTGMSKVSWSTSNNNYETLTWWKAEFSFHAKHKNNRLAINLGALGKGYAYLNGHEIGRYWNYTADGNCSSCAHQQIHNTCDYSHWQGDSFHCRCDCGIPSQEYYKVPSEWLVKGTNHLVIIEELGVSQREISAIKFFEMNRH